MTTVVHHRSPGRQAAELAGTYVYCGRPSKWGNPYKMLDPTPFGRREAIDRFTEYWNAPARAPLRAAALVELVDKVLGCFCHPKPCHCHVIAEYVNNAHAPSRPPVPTRP